MPCTTTVPHEALDLTIDLTRHVAERGFEVADATYLVADRTVAAMLRSPRGDCFGVAKYGRTGLVGGLVGVTRDVAARMYDDLRLAPAAC